MEVLWGLAASIAALLVGHWLGSVKSDVDVRRSAYIRFLEAAADARQTLERLVTDADAEDPVLEATRAIAGAATRYSELDLVTTRPPLREHAVNVVIWLEQLRDLALGDLSEAAEVHDVDGIRAWYRYHRGLLIDQMRTELRDPALIRRVRLAFQP